ncbi:hypothetical protein [Candidatus Parabeggiatoa sp. HSG14]|uniref:hypothetical protein n=1 Tax=Candidatus Parabeggiatoa sp. HSG14 TaxID=3055593 RepID=UPI0025A90051|nr:hypothetical protein [Thiotrichales bacterium HSG14]
MAKCPVCNTRKGKRKCLVTETIICSACCGDTRKLETCEGCSHYQTPESRRRYNTVPFHTLEVMAEDTEIQEQGLVIESALCAFDDTNGSQLRDTTVIRVLELLLNKYHFKDSDVDSKDELLLQGFQQVVDAINEKLSDLSDENLTKIIGAILFVAKKRSKGKREYLQLVHQYVVDPTN